MRRAISCVALFTGATLFAVSAGAKLPALNDEAKAKVAAAAAKTGWTDKVSAYQLCRAMDRSAEYYRKSNKAAPAAVETPACADPGPFVAPPAPGASGAAPAVAAAAPPPAKK